MLFTQILLAAAAAAPVAAHTVHSVIVFTRHGDRTAKFYKNYQLTNLGSQQVYASGQFYRSEYLTSSSHAIKGISVDKALPAQLWASAPDQAVLYQTATNFLQGLYPPLDQLNTTLATEQLTNGTGVQDPIDGYQFVLVHGEAATDPDTIWIKGDEGCPTFTKAYNSYANSTDYKTTLDRTSAFYSQFQPLLAPILGASNVSYAEAYNVFDLLNVASIHNASVAGNISADNLDQLRYLANQWEWNHNFNASLPARSIGGQAFAGGILRQMDTIVKGKAALKFNVLAGSYNTFLGFFGLTNLTAASPNFYGLPNYAASMAFELFSDDASEAEHNGTFPSDPNTGLKVRFLFRNGTDDSEPLQAYPLFGRSVADTDMTYGNFVAELGSRAINTVGTWCTTCQSTNDFCVAATQSSQGAQTTQSSSSGLSNAAAGGIGAGVTLAVVFLVGGLAFALLRRRKAASSAGAPPAHGEKNVAASDSESA